MLSVFTRFPFLNPSHILFLYRIGLPVLFPVNRFWISYSDINKSFPNRPPRYQGAPSCQCTLPRHRPYSYVTTLLVFFSHRPSPHLPTLS